ncbi:heparan-alpha-glucosaminide N-acetyltransferase domain-containing protein [Geodermatophilus normandii]|uniref:heparan-alpha-glucosaminide N-acetyltransferase domain-containing protein n=1 Tax=Geodermatophilus normandii TaxID=1137989 RepID=UPI0014764C13|nr:heparan-alpha-glucosaminide N-acetyltransferase domain-containing protein [Geodermatophilus normandii]
MTRRPGPRGAAAASAPPAPARPRLRSVDVLRGLAVVGMLLVDNRGNGAIPDQLEHVPWNGLHVADVVFPVFLLVVGVSMPFSRRADRPRAALRRTVLLALLGWLVVTAKYRSPTAGAGVLGHVAGAYLLCWLLLRLPRRAQVPTAAVVLVLLGVATVVGGAGPDRSWGHALDAALGVRFSAEAPHGFPGSAVTVFLGVLAGRALRSGPGRAALGRLTAGGAALLATGLALAPLVPLNKRLWSPSFVLVTGGIALLALALLHLVVDERGRARPFRPFEVLGTEAIVAFVLSEVVFRAVLSHTVQPAVDGWVTSVAGAAVSAWLYPLLSIGVIWAVCAALLRRGVVVRV